MKKILAFLTVISLTCMISITTFAANFSDVKGHWAQSFIQRWSDEKIINGYEDSTFKPDNNITRAEYVAMIMRIFETNQTADISKYTDVNSSAWYYDVLSKCYAMGAINGYESNLMMPEAKITRQEAIVILNRLLKLSSTSNSNSFADSNEIAEWAKSSIIAFADSKYINGYEDGTIKPNSYITRAETTKILDQSISKIISTSGEYNMDGISENVVIKANNVSLKNTNKIKKIFVVNDSIKSSLVIDGINEVIVIDSIARKDEVVNKPNTENADDSNIGNEQGGAAGTEADNKEDKKFVLSLKTKGNAYDVSKEGTFDEGTKLTIRVNGKDVITDELFAKDRFSQFKLNVMSALELAYADKIVSGSKLKNTLKNNGINTSDTSKIDEILGDILSDEDKAFIEELIGGGKDKSESEKEDTMVQVGLMFLNMDYDSFKTMINKLG